MVLFSIFANWTMQNMNGEGRSGNDQGGEARYRGVRRRPWGKFVTRQGMGLVFGSERSTRQRRQLRAYDRAAYTMQGHLAVLNFPNEYPSLGGSSSSAVASAPRRQDRQVIEFECVDDKVLEELLEHEY